MEKWFSSKSFAGQILIIVIAAVMISFITAFTTTYYNQKMDSKDIEYIKSGITRVEVDTKEIKDNQKTFVTKDEFNNMMSNNNRSLDNLENRYIYNLNETTTIKTNK